MTNGWSARITDCEAFEVRGLKVLTEDAGKLNGAGPEDIAGAAKVETK